MIRFSRTVTLVAFGLLATSAYAVEPFATYDRFNRKAQRINPNKWLGGEWCCLAAETSRRIQSKKLVMTHRNYGDPSSDNGGTRSVNVLYFPNPGPISQIKAHLRIKSYELTNCATNSDDSGNVRVRFVGSFFNTEEDTSMGETGDVWASIGLRRNLTTKGGRRKYDVAAWVSRCDNEDCSKYTDLPLPMGLGQVTNKATVSIIHDPDNDKFTFRVNKNDPLDVSYAGQKWNEKSEPTVAEKRLVVLAQSENCSTKRATAAIDARIDNVMVNKSALP